MKTIILTLIFALSALFSFAANSDSLKRDMEDYDYLVSFVENNYAPFDAIMQKGYKREYKALKKRLRKQLSSGKVGLEKAANDYVLWFYGQFDRHIQLESDTFLVAVQIQGEKAIVKLDSTLLINPGNFEIAPMPVSCKVDSQTWLIRVPSCEPGFYDSTVNALQQFLVSDCENLIIDIRWNGGGGDNVWEPFAVPSSHYVTSLPFFDTRNR
jgi:hypothetical protein